MARVRRVGGQRIVNSICCAATLLALGVASGACSGDDRPPTAPTSTGPTVLHDSLTPVTAQGAVQFQDAASRPPGPYYITTDDFMSPATGTVRTLRWLGVYCEQLLNGARLPDAAADGFYVGIYNDPGGYPSIPLSPATGTYIMDFYTPAQVGERFVGTADVTCGSRQVPAAFYEYTLTLQRPFSVTAGNRYWVVIHASIPDVGNTNFSCNRCVMWGWRTSAIRDNSYSLNSRFTNAFAPFDLAFQVSR
jgi:hypothetical protein